MAALDGSFMPTASERIRAARERSIVEDQYEIALPKVVEGIAQGATLSEIEGWLDRVYPRLRGQYDKLIREALDDALSCGIERDDIDPTLFR